MVKAAIAAILGENGYSAMYFLLDDDIRRIHRIWLVYPSRHERLKPREREREKQRRGEKERINIEASERVVKAEEDLEPWKAPITVARVRLPSGTRFIPQLLRTSIKECAYKY